MIALPPLLAMLISYSPLMAVWMVGVVLTIARWKLHPRVSLLALVAIGIFFLTMAGDIFVNLRLPEMARQGSLGDGSLQRFFIVASLIRTFFNILAWGLLLAAVFGWRKEPVSTIL